MGSGSSVGRPENPFGPKGWTPDRLGRLDGKVYVITGTTTGLGVESTKLLLSRGAEVVMLNRSEERANAFVEELKGEFGVNTKVSNVKMDLAVLGSVRHAAAEVLKKVGRIDALIENACIAQVAKQELTVDGFESQLAVNHFGHFLLCGLLFQRIEESKGRVVVVSSTGYKMGIKRIQFEDLNWDNNYQHFSVYCHSKLAQTMFAFELQRRIEAAGKDVLVQVCHPGAAKTECGAKEAPFYFKLILKALTPIAQSAEKGSWPQVLCATQEGLKSNVWYGPTLQSEMKGPISESTVEAFALDNEEAARLWSVSEDKTHFKWNL